MSAFKEVIVSDTNPVQVITVTGGKGGVGKTNIALNVSIELAARGRRVVLMDGDLACGTRSCARSRIASSA